VGGAVSHRLARSAAVGPPYTPADLQDAYDLADKAALPSDQTVAIVDAYDDPSAEADLAVYRSAYGLPPCTTANLCFRKVNQTGGPLLPSANVDWAGEIALDIQMVSAVCPHCKILLVETNSNSTVSLLAGVKEAKLLGATQISNSWGGSEFSTENLLETNLSLAVPITVSSGDDGYGVQYPAASGQVTAVGGTSLKRASNIRGWTESAWAGAGSGCSKVIAKPAWQQDTGCAKRTVADVSAVADPKTGVAVYNTYGGGGPWWQVGGTSAAAPIVAASYALLGSDASSPSFPYDNPSSFNDVQSGSNGSCTFAYLCTGFVGFDGPTGIGSPNLAGTGNGSTAVTGAPPPATPTPTPAPQPVTPVNPTPVAPLLSSVAVASSAVRSAQSGRVKVRVGCGQGAPCSGVLTLQTRLSNGHLRTLGRRQFNLASGRTAWVTVRLPRSSLRFLQHRRSLLVYATARDGDGTSAQSSFRLRAPKLRKHRRR
jgi:subtilase family serine protease